MIDLGFLASTSSGNRDGFGLAYMETRGNPGEVITESEKNRAGAIYAEDAGCEVRKSHENPAVTKIYGEFLTDGPCGEKSHHLPHTHCVARVKYID